MPQRLSLILLILCGVLGTLTGTALPRDDQAFQRGMAAFKRQDHTTALREWQPLAQQGYSGKSSKAGQFGVGPVR